jgi:O-antigen ligase
VLPNSIERIFQNSILLTSLLVTIIFLPTTHLDPFNVPKYFILVVASCSLLALLVTNVKFLFMLYSKMTLFAIFSFPLVLVFVFIFNFEGSPNQLHGTYGRNTGFLAYISLWILFVVCMMITSKHYAKSLLYTFISTGWFNALYGAFQSFGLDVVKYDFSLKVLGTFGNPNFVSSHLALTSLASLCFICSSQSSKTRLFLFLNILISLFVIIRSTSSQGLFLFFILSPIILYIRFLKEKQLIRVFFKASYSLSLIIGTLGVFNKGPLAGYLNQSSTTYRGDYWRVAWNATSENPISGLGLDSFGDWYRFYRDDDAFIRRGADLVTNAAHNVFLDISANGGLLFLASYLLILGVVGRSAFRLVIKRKAYDPIALGLVATWLGYNIQSFISINQLGIAIWGWILGGSIKGYDIYLQGVENKTIKLNSKEKNVKAPSSAVIFRFFGFVAGVLFAISPFKNDNSFYQAIRSGDSDKLIAAANNFPLNTYYLNYAGSIFLSNKLEKQALELARKSIEVNPRDFNAWNLLTSNPLLGEEERTKSFLAMKKLDPLNKTLGKT